MATSDTTQDGPDQSPGQVLAFDQSRRRSASKSIGNFEHKWNAHLAISDEDAFHASEVGYICRALVQATLPYREPKGDPPAWGRTNGKVSLVVQPGYFMKQVEEVVRGKTVTKTVPASIGYPYGSIPRLLLAWIGREVKIKKEREIQLGKSLAGFMGDLGMTTQSGGKNGNITRLRDQMKRTFSAKIAIMDNPDVVSSFEASDWRNEGFNLVDRSQIWWDPTSPTQSNLFESHIQLSERFYDELVNNPVPVDMRALRALRASPSSLDLYCFLTYRAFNLKRTTTVPWEALKMQFGSEIANDRKFRWQFREALKSVMVVYPEARADLSDTGLILQPSRTSVPRRVEK